MGLPALAIVIFSPAWTRSKWGDRWVFVTWMLAWALTGGAWTKAWTTSTGSGQPSQAPAATVAEIGRADSSLTG